MARTPTEFTENSYGYLSMDGLHVAIVSHPGQAHTYPSLGLCPEFVRRGHRVTFVTDVSNGTLVSEAGAHALIMNPAEFKVIGDFADISSWSAYDPRWWDVYASSVYPWLLANAENVIRQHQSFFEKDRPDVILYDSIAYAGRIIGHHLGVPMIRTSPHFAPPEGYLYRAHGCSVNPPPLREFAKSLDAFFLSHGVSVRDELWRTEDHNIYFVPREFQYDADSYGSRYVFIGACLEREFESVWCDNSRGKPIVLVSDMSGNNDPAYFKLFTEALSGMNCHVILTVSESFPITALGTLPSGVEINHHASHLEILPHASLSISRGGNGSVLEAVYNGVPVLAIPLHQYHEETAYRTAQLGIGIHLPKEQATAESIRESVDALLHDAGRQESVRQMRQAFRAAGGASLAVDTVERAVA